MSTTLTPQQLPSELQQDLIEIKPLLGGLTNRSWKVSRKPGDVIWRPASPLLVDLGMSRQAEYDVLSFLHCHSFAPDVHYFGEEGIANQWIDGTPLTRTPEPFTMIEVMAQYHQLELNQSLLSALPKFDYLYKVSTYWNNVSDSNRFESVERLVTLALSAPKSLFETEIQCLLHCDLGYYNLIQTENGIAIIDWEYACIGDPIIDAVLTSMACRYRVEGFVGAYSDAFGLDRAEQVARAQQMKFYFEIMSMLWYLVCYEHNGDESYLLEAKQMADALCNSDHCLSLQG